MPREYKIKDRTGEKHGKLTVLSLVSRAVKKILWKCICECGKEKVINGNDLTKIVSCGCAIGEAQRTKSPSLLNKIFGDLTVINPAGSKGGHTLWECLCSCGNIKIINRTSLLNGRTKSCGCKHYLIGKDNPRYKHEITDDQRKEKLRRYSPFKTWRQKVYSKDDHTCQISGIQSFEKWGLEAHHIFNWKDYEPLRFDVDNGLVMLSEVHWAFHQIYGRSDNNMDQVVEFKERYLNGEFDERIDRYRKKRKEKAGVLAPASS